MRTIADQRMQALKKAVEQKQKFDSLAELRKIKALTVLSHLLEFDCATAQNLLRLLDQKNNGILTRLVKDKLIKIKRWQNAQVYIPTAKGKAWLLENITDEQEIERVRNTPIKRRISGYSHEHDLLLQNAAIEWATCEAEENESWRLFKPRKTQQSGKVPDAIAVFEKDNKTRSIIIELERTRKSEVGIVCALSRLIDLLIENDDHVIMLTPNHRIYQDYTAAIWALMAFDDGGLEMKMPMCQTIPGLIPKPGIGAAQGGALYDGLVQNAVQRIDVEMIDETGETIIAVDDFEGLLFNPMIWQICMRQPQPNWKNVIRRASEQLAEHANFYLRENDHNPTIGIPEIIEDKEEKIYAEAQALEKLLTGAFEGPEADGNPMRSKTDLASAWKRWQTIRSA